MNDKLILHLIGIIASLALLVLSLQPLIPVQLSTLEAVAAIASAWSVWLLAHNHIGGWWIGLVGVTTYAIVFYQVQLYAGVAIQLFYFLTSVQAIYIWLRGGEHQTEKPIGRVSRSLLILTAILAILGVLGLRKILMIFQGAVPFWDALTTMMSACAQLYLMGRYLESWYLWIAVDTIYVPLYVSRGLYLTSFLYRIFWLMALKGLRNFITIYQQQQLQRQEEMKALL